MTWPIIGTARYDLIGHVTVTSGATLTIASGVTVFMDNITYPYININAGDGSSPGYLQATK
jgi:hypothetical protein